MKGGAYVIDLGGYEPIENYSVALCVNGDKETHLNSFGVEYIPKEIYEIMKSKIITTNIFGIHACN